MKHRRLLESILVGLVLVGCSPAEEHVVVSGSTSTTTTVMSRGVEVPITFTTPLLEDDSQVPLVVLAHGHGGDRHEGGGYTQLAEELARLGLASVRMDFPGCGDSTESFAENNLSNMLEDIAAARAFGVSQAQIDNARVGLLGFSMGGRLAALTSQRDPSYKAMVLWAPAVSNGAAREEMSFGGADVYAEMRREAKEKGEVHYTTQYGQDLVLGMRWFTDMEESMPLQAIAQYKGPLMVLYGDSDDVVPPAISESAIEAASSSSEVVRHVMPGVGHDLGIYTGLEDVAAEVISSSASFLKERL